MCKVQLARLAAARLRTDDFAQIAKTRLTHLLVQAGHGLSNERRAFADEAGVKLNKAGDHRERLTESLVRTPTERDSRASVRHELVGHSAEAND
jgi:hypothetical protein